jgi:hypothetical protein
MNEMKYRPGSANEIANARGALIRSGARQREHYLQQCVGSTASCPASDEISFPVKVRAAGAGRDEEVPVLHMTAGAGFPIE